MSQRLQHDDPHRRDAERLFETDRGHVSRCACCGTLEVRFGNALIALRDEELSDVVFALAESETDGGRRETILQVNETGCGWVFDQGEAAELHRLLAATRLLLELPS